MLFISPWLGESLAFVTGVVTIFFLIRRKDGEQDIHYAIRADLDLFKNNHIIKKQWKNDPDFYKSIRQKYENLYKRFPKEINKQAGMIG
jgi:hypothetical protein